jgi:hypothetical protein
MLADDKTFYDFAHSQFQGYLDPMDRGAQGLILDYLDNPRIASGICLMLSINWIIESIASGPATAWQTMKSHGPIYFKQIGQQQQGYKNDITKLNHGDAKGTVTDCIKLASRDARDVQKAIDVDSPTDANFLAAAVGQGLANGTTTPPSALIVFWFKEGGGHAVAASLKNGLTYLYDPNFGVFKVDPKSGSIDALVGKLFAAYKRYGKTIDNGVIFAIK